MPQSEPIHSNEAAIERQPINEDNLRNAVKNLFDTTNANEISDTLSGLMDVYIENNDHTRTHVADTVNTVFKLQQLLFNLEKFLVVLVFFGVYQLNDVL